MPKIIIVDDHDLFRLGLQTTLKNRHADISVVGEAHSGTSLFSLLKTTACDLVLLDIALPDMSGIEIARILKTKHPKLKIIVISADNSAPIIEELIDIGIEGFINKSNCNSDTLAEAIRSVMQGIEYFGKDISEIIYRIYVAQKKTSEISSEFSEQEKSVIQYCHQGLSGKQIADRLNLSLRTVDWHKSNIFRKLGINTTLEMVRFAVKNGIIK